MRRVSTVGNGTYLDMQMINEMACYDVQRVSCCGSLLRALRVLRYTHTSVFNVILSYGIHLTLSTSGYSYMQAKFILLCCAISSPRQVNCICDSLL